MATNSLFNTKVAKLALAGVAKAAGQATRPKLKDLTRPQQEGMPGKGGGNSLKPAEWQEGLAGGAEKPAASSEQPSTIGGGSRQEATEPPKSGYMAYLNHRMGTGYAKNGRVTWRVEGAGRMSKAKAVERIQRDWEAMGQSGQENWSKQASGEAFLTPGEKQQAEAHGRWRDRMQGVQGSSGVEGARGLGPATPGTRGTPVGGGGQGMARTMEYRHGIDGPDHRGSQEYGIDSGAKPDANTKEQAYSTAPAQSSGGLQGATYNPDGSAQKRYDADGNEIEDKSGLVGYRTGGGTTERSGLRDREYVTDGKKGGFYDPEVSAAIRDFRTAKANGQDPIFNYTKGPVGNSGYNRTYVDGKGFMDPGAARMEMDLMRNKRASVRDLTAATSSAPSNAGIKSGDVAAKPVGAQPVAQSPVQPAAPQNEMTSGDLRKAQNDQDSMRFRQRTARLGDMQRQLPDMQPTDTTKGFPKPTQSVGVTPPAQPSPLTEVIQGPGTPSRTAQVGPDRPKEQARGLQRNMDSITSQFPSLKTSPRLADLTKK